jgi:hypothetical protein
MSFQEVMERKRRAFIQSGGEPRALQKSAGARDHFAGLNRSRAWRATIRNPSRSTNKPRIFSGKLKFFSCGGERRVFNTRESQDFRNQQQQNMAAKALTKSQKL